MMGCRGSRRRAIPLGIWCRGSAEPRMNFLGRATNAKWDAADPSTAASHFSYGASDPMSFRGRATYQQWDGAASRARASHFSYGAQRCANFSARKLPGPKRREPEPRPGPPGHKARAKDPRSKPGAREVLCKFWAQGLDHGRNQAKTAPARTAPPHAHTPGGRTG